MMVFVLVGHKHRVVEALVAQFVSRYDVLSSIVLSVLIVSFLGRVRVGRVVVVVVLRCAQSTRIFERQKVSVTFVSVCWPHVRPACHDWSWCSSSAAEYGSPKLYVCLAGRVACHN